MGEEDELYLLLWCIGIFLVSFLVISISITLPIALWKIFKKAGEKGWKSIIPIYNFVILNKIVGISPWIVLLPLFGIALIVVSNMVNNFKYSLIDPGIYYLKLSYISSLILDIAVFIFLCMSTYIAYRLSKSFGKKGTFAIGLVLLPFIFYPILAFGKSQYVGTNGNTLQNSNFNRVNANFNSQNPSTNIGNQNFSNTNIGESKYKNKTKNRNNIVIIMVVMIILMVLVEVGKFFEYKEEYKMEKDMSEAHQLVHGYVKYGQEISYSDIVEANKLPENIVVTIYINGKQLSDNETFKFNKLGTYDLGINFLYFNERTHKTMEEEHWSESIDIVDKEKPVKIGYGSASDE